MDGEVGKLGLSGQRASEPANGILDAALLPRRVRITEVGLQVELVGQEVMQGELRTAIEGECFAQWRRDRLEQFCEAFGSALGFAIGRMVEDGEARLSFMGDKQVVTVFGEQHEVRFPVSRRGAIGGLDGPLTDRAAELDGAGGAAAAFAQASAPEFATGQQAMPIVLLRRAMIDKTID